MSLPGSGVLGGLPLQLWIAVYGKGLPQSPMAIVAHAEVPQGWYWDSDSRRPFSVDEGVEIFDGVGYQACTYIVDAARDPFDVLAGVTDEQKREQPVRWLARGFAARFNFNLTKIIFEYREPLPADMAPLEVLTMAQTDQLKAFEQRAREVFTVGPAPEDRSGLTVGYARTIRWQFMDQRFLGTVSKYEPLTTN